MKTLEVYPNEWPCTLAECPPGLFTYGEELCFKSEYRTDAHADAYICESGEAFWAGAADFTARDNLIVQPCNHMWMDDSEE